MSRPPVVETPPSPRRERDRSISRRTLLSLAGAAVAGSAGVLFLRRDHETLYPWEREALARLRHRLALAGEPRVLGPASLDALGEESPGALAADLFRGPGRFRGRDVDSALAALQDQIRDDYAMGRTLSVADWEISQSEARLFALLHAMDRPSDRPRS